MDKNIVRPKPHNVKIVKPNIDIQKIVTEKTVEQIACKRCGKIKDETAIGDYCLQCEQVIAYNKARSNRDKENNIENPKDLLSPNDMTDKEFMSWMTMTQQKPFTTVKINN